MHTLKNKMIATKIIIICILCSVVACDCKACRNPRTTPTPQGTEQTPKILTPITDEMIVFAGIKRHTQFLQNVLIALKNGTPTDIDELNSDVSHTASYGYSALHQAAKFLPLDSVSPPIQKAKASELTKKIIKALLDRGAAVNVKGLHSETPLHLAADFNKLAAAEALVEHADVNAQDKYGNKPLALANDMDIQALLRNHGAT